MAKHASPKPAKTAFRAKVTGRHAVTLPAELCRRLHIEAGDIVELDLVGGQALLRKASNEQAEPPPLRGLLSDYFTDRADVQRFLEEERRGSMDEGEAGERATRRASAPGATWKGSWPARSSLAGQSASTAGR